MNNLLHEFSYFKKMLRLLGSLLKFQDKHILVSAPFAVNGKNQIETIRWEKHPASRIFQRL